MRHPGMTAPGHENEFRALDEFPGCEGAYWKRQEPLTANFGWLLLQRSGMDFAAAYCPTRRDIEKRGWVLTSQLFSLTARLLKKVGDDHGAFMALREECRAAKLAITASNQSLRDHRREHGC
jgi:hypothetical protein